MGVCSAEEGALLARCGTRATEWIPSTVVDTHEATGDAAAASFPLQ
jgi:hypothetical protein